MSNIGGGLCPPNLNIGGAGAPPPAPPAPTPLYILLRLMHDETRTAMAVISPMIAAVTIMTSTAIVALLGNWIQLWQLGKQKPDTSSR